VGESPARETKYGLVHDEPGWFVLSARDARWREWTSLGTWCDFEGKKRFQQFGFNISVLRPGESLGYYHEEKAQEDFLVVAGECILIVDDQEKRLGLWDFFHCPPGTPHMIVGAGENGAVVVAVGARGRGRSGIVYRVSETARRHGVSVEQETKKPAEAYAGLPRSERVEYGGWLPDL
jgi:uncharacterized cupin superfamily protein